MEFLDEEEDDEFPVEGLYVPFRAASTRDMHLRDTTTTFHTMTCFTRKTFIFRCPICKVKDARKTEITRHYKRMHPTHSIPCLNGN